MKCREKKWSIQKFKRIFISTKDLALNFTRSHSFRCVSSHNMIGHNLLKKSQQTLNDPKQPTKPMRLEFQPDSNEHINKNQKKNTHRKKAQQEYERI